MEMVQSASHSHPTEKHQPIIVQSSSHLPLGVLLCQADLLSSAQMELALQDQKNYPDLKFEDILVLHGWIKQKTADFFALHWQYLVHQAQTEKPKYKLGQYFQAAALLQKEQIQEILKMQQSQQLLFGELAVAQGYIKPKTLEFFLSNLLPNNPKKATSKPENNSHRIEKCHERAETYLQIKQPSLAIRELKEAIQLELNNSSSHGLLALAYFKSEQHKLGKVHLMKAHSLNPNDPIILKHKSIFQKMMLTP